MLRFSYLSFLLTKFFYSHGMKQMNLLTSEHPFTEVLQVPLNYWHFIILENIRETNSCGAFMATLINTCLIYLISDTLCLLLIQQTDNAVKQTDFSNEFNYFGRHAMEFKAYIRPFRHSLVIPIFIEYSLEVTSVWRTRTQLPYHYPMHTSLYFQSTGLYTSILS